jgi:precorrin-6Y C5,15-methyltransferase (decarboxylating)
VVLCLDPGLLGERFAGESGAGLLKAAGGFRRPSPKRWVAGWAGPAGAWALGESMFEHRDGQITKAEVRAQILARLAPSLGELVWDLGAGSGSVGIECARFGAAVVAVEQDASSCGRIAGNAAAHGVEVAVVRGRAPGVLAELPRPDAVFVGGGGVDVVRGALEHGPARIVVALAGVERVGEVVQSLEADGREVGGVLTQFSRMAALPDGTHRFAALNPVYLVWGSAA